MSFVSDKPFFFFLEKKKRSVNTPSSQRIQVEQEKKNKNRVSEGEIE